MLTEHINGQGFLVFDIFAKIFVETYTIARYLCMVVLESINSSTTFRFENFTKELSVSKNLVTISPSKFLLLGIVFVFDICLNYGFCLDLELCLLFNLALVKYNKKLKLKFPYITSQKRGLVLNDMRFF